MMNYKVVTPLVLPLIKGRDVLIKLFGFCSPS